MSLQAYGESTSVEIPCLVINFTSECASYEDRAFRGLEACEIHSVAPSLLFRVNLVFHLVLRAVIWKCWFTFIAFYLWDLSHKLLDIFCLGAMNAAQGITLYSPLALSSYYCVIGHVEWEGMASAILWLTKSVWLFRRHIAIPVDIKTELILSVCCGFHMRYLAFYT